MGGGGGGGWDPLGDTKGLEEKAKAVLREGKRNVFISFAMEDQAEVNLLRAQAKNENNDLEFNDHSVREPYDSTRAEYIKSKIAERIARASVCVVYISSDTAQSRWVHWEVQKGLELGKKVVATYSGEAPPANLPSWIGQHGIKLVPWSALGPELE